MSAKILIVDDSATMRHQIELILVKEGYVTIEAVDGNDGLAKLDENPDIRLIFIDINMPQMGGLEMLEKIKNDGKHPGVASVMLTTEIDKAKLVRAQKAGAKGWIIKPFGASQLVDVTKKFAGP